MKVKNNSQNNVGGIVTLFDEAYLHKQRIAGKCVLECLQTCENILQSQVKLTSKNLEEQCGPIFKKYNCTPTFLNYQPKGMSPFPGSICVSINNELVHGIPKDQEIISGDVVKVDLGATYDNAIADAARSFIFGEPKNKEHVEMQKLCKLSLYNAIQSIKIGKKTGEIGYAIYRTIKNSPYRLITEYGGHGIGLELKTKKGKAHAYPFIENKSQIQDGVIIMPGMSFAIEPLLVKGDNRTRIALDGWTVLVDSVSFHEEHTLFITDNGPEIIA